MRNIMLVASVVFGLAACSKSAGDEAISKMEGFKDQVCACKDKECAEKVQKEMLEWLTAFAEKNKDLKPSKDQDEKADKIQDEMQKCLEKLEGEKKE